MLRGERAFAALIVLAVVSSLVLGGVLAALLPRVAFVATHGPDGRMTVVSLLLGGFATLGITLGSSSLLRQLFATARLIRRMLTHRVETPEEVDIAAGGLELAGRIDVVDDERLFSFCYWFIRPRICLSTALVRRLDRDELRAVLLHERYHLVHRDPLRLIVARYLAAGLYVMPVVEDLVEHFTLEKELEADQHAVSRIGLSPLARALYALLPDADPPLGPLVPVGALSVTEARIDHLVEGRPLEMRISPASVALSFGALTAAAILAAAQAPVTAQVPPALTVPGLLVAPASLLFVAAVSGGVEQLRLVVHR